MASRSWVNVNDIERIDGHVKPIILIGRLTSDPELRYTPNGVAVTRFSLAVNRRFTNANGERETDFINIVTWNKLAENCGLHLKKAL